MKTTSPIKTKNDLLLSTILDKMELYMEMLEKHGDSLLILSDKSLIWKRLHQLRFKLERLDSYLAVRK